MKLLSLFKRKPPRCQHIWGDWEIRNGGAIKWKGSRLQAMCPETSWDPDAMYYDWQRTCTICGRYYIMIDGERLSRLRNDEYPTGNLRELIDADW